MSHDVNRARLLLLRDLGKLFCVRNALVTRAVVCNNAQIARLPRTLLLSGTVMPLIISTVRDGFH